MLVAIRSLSRGTMSDLPFLTVQGLGDAAMASVILLISSSVICGPIGRLSTSLASCSEIGSLCAVL